MKLLVNGFLYESVEDNREGFRNITLNYLKEQGHSESITPKGTIMVYHGTSRKNLDNILKTQSFKGHPWFSLDIETATKFSKQAGKDPVVKLFEVDPSAVLPIGGKDYLSARLEGLTLKGWTSNNNIWHLPGTTEIIA